MHTEAEAKQKWCPLSRLCEMGSTYNRSGPLANLTCIGSDCMAWRSEVASLSHTDRFGEHPEIVLGYCGAFGKPS